MRSDRVVRLCAAIAVAVAAVLLLSHVAAAQTSCGFSTQRVQCGDLACDKDRKVCIACRSDSDCYPGAMRCDADSGKCQIRGFTALFGWRTVLAMLIAFSVCSIAVVAGLGGGGILVPAFCALIEIPMQSAVGLSQSTICGQSTLNMYLAVQQKYPDSSWDRPLINYQYLSLLLPLGLVGTLIGGILSKVCPDVLRLVLLFTLLSVVLYRTVHKMRAQYKEDTSAQQVTVEAGDANAAARQQDYGSGDKNGNQELAKVAASPVSPQSQPAADAASPVSPQSQPAAERVSQPQYPQQELAMNFACFLVLLVFNIFRSFVACGGFMYWMCVLIPLAFLGVAFYYNREKLCKLAESDPAQLTFTWSQQTSVMYPMAAVIAGAAAAMLGIGGGLVLSFVLYEVGLVPQEASVTGGMATFFIAFSSTLQLLVTGSLVVDFGLIFFVVGLCSTALGQFVFMKYIKEHGLNYLIVASLAFVVGGSLIVLGGYGIYNAVITSSSGGSVMAFGRLCARAPTKS